MLREPQTETTPQSKILHKNISCSVLRVSPRQRNVSCASIRTIPRTLIHASSSRERTRAEGNKEMQSRNSAQAPEQQSLFQEHRTFPRFKKLSLELRERSDLEEIVGLRKGCRVDLSEEEAETVGGLLDLVRSLPLASFLQVEKTGSNSALQEDGMDGMDEMLRDLGQYRRRYPVDHKLVSASLGPELFATCLGVVLNLGDVEDDSEEEFGRKISMWNGRFTQDFTLSFPSIRKVDVMFVCDAKDFSGRLYDESRLFRRGNILDTDSTAYDVEVKEDVMEMMEVLFPPENNAGREGEGEEGNNCYLPIITTAKVIQRGNDGVAGCRAVDSLGRRT